MRRIIKNPDISKRVIAVAIAIKALEVIRDSPGGGPGKRIALQALNRIKEVSLEERDKPYDEWASLRSYFYKQVPTTRKMGRWGVVKDEVNKIFTKIHLDEMEAHKEARRLCHLEGKPFLVIQIIGRYYQEERPLDYESFT